MLRIAALLSAMVCFSAACADAAPYGTTEPNDPSDDDLVTAEEGEGSADDDAPAAPAVSRGGAAAAPADPVASAPAYKSQPTAVRAAARHADAKVAVVPSKDAKCLSCHGGAGAPRFLFGGSAYEDGSSAARAKDVEVGLIDAAGTTVFVHSDADGNFWVPAADARALVFPAYVSVRMDEMKKPMKRRLASAADLECHSCHGATKPIVKP